MSLTMSVNYMSEANGLDLQNQQVKYCCNQRDFGMPGLYFSYIDGFKSETYFRIRALREELLRGKYDIVLLQALS